MGPELKKPVRQDGCSLSRRRPRTFKRNDQASDEEHNEFHTKRALRMEELTRYSSSEDPESEDEPAPFRRGAFKPEVFWARLLDGKRRRIKGKQPWYEIEEAQTPEK